MTRQEKDLQINELKQLLQDNSVVYLTDALRSPYAENRTYSGAQPFLGALTNEKLPYWLLLCSFP